MSEPQPAKRIAEARDDLSANPFVAAVDVDRYVDNWGIILTLYPECDRVPPSVCRTIGENDLGIGTIAQMGHPTHIQVLCR